MNAQTRLFDVLLILVTPIGGVTEHKPIPAASECGVLEQALSASRHVTVDKQRKTLKSTSNGTEGFKFQAPRGIRMHSAACFIWTWSSTQQENAEVAFSPDDTVKSVSKLYVEYEAKD